MPSRRADLFTSRITGMRFEPRPRFKCIRDFVLSPTDTARFVAELRKEFPTIRFLPLNYSYHWIDLVPATPHAIPDDDAPRERMRPPHRDPMPYVHSLADIERDVALAWLEPPGWSPRWSAKPFRQARYVLRNAPQQRFLFLNSQYTVEKARDWRSSGASSQPPSSLTEGDICHLSGGFLQGPYRPGDRTQIAFLSRVWRIARKITTDKLVRVDPETLRPRLDLYLEASLRVGLDAAEWTRRDPRHLVGYEIVYRAADALP